MIFALPSTTSVDDRESLATVLSTARRILVLGSPGSGKTYLSRRMAPKLALNHVELDDHFWVGPDRWMDPPAWRNHVGGLAAEKEWLIDGTYESTLELRAPRAELAIVIEAGRLSCLRRVITRRLSLVLEGQRHRAPGQRLDRRFLSYVWGYPRRVRPVVWQKLRQRGEPQNIVTLAGARGIDALLEHFPDR